MIRGVRMNIQVVFPVLISFAISVILGPVIIPFLRKLKMGQTERVEGVQSHKAQECTYNDQRKCTASAIDVAGCSTDGCNETKCNTFSCKC